jgi:hypothetical protein
VASREFAANARVRLKLAGNSHIEGVALDGRGNIGSYSALEIERHFTRLMSPSNMLVVPADVVGLAEVAMFIEGYCSAR